MVAEHVTGAKESDPQPIVFSQPEVLRIVITLQHVRPGEDRRVVDRVEKRAALPYGLARSRHALFPHDLIGGVDFDIGRAHQV